MNSNIIGHFQKVNKNTLWVKASCMNMENPIEMKPKGLFRGHPKLSKKSKNTTIRLKLRDIFIAKVDQFLKKMHKSQCEQFGFFELMGVSFGSQTYPWTYLRYLNPLFYFY